LQHDGQAAGVERPGHFGNMTARQSVALSGHQHRACYSGSMQSKASTAGALAFVAIATCACNASNDPVDVDLRVLAQNPAAFRDQEVRTCGWARNAFEDMSISTTRIPVWTETAPYHGLAVAWLPRSARTNGEAEWRCVTGRVSGDCGPTGAFAEDCRANVSPYPWVIIEAPCDDPSEPRCRLMPGRERFED
jgi:hypothetical protein